VSERRVNSASAGRSWSDSSSSTDNRAHARFATPAGSWETAEDPTSLTSFAGFGGHCARRAHRTAYSFATGGFAPRDSYDPFRGSVRQYATSDGQENEMITLGIILLIIGFIAKVVILWTIGIILVVIGLIFVVLGAMGRAVGGRRHYY
jgi:hypothetical protein